MGTIEVLQSYPAAFVAVAAVLGLVVGSFLNVVIYRLPLMLQRQWHAQCEELLEQSSADASAAAPDFNLIVPRSQCPHCRHQISALENIPLVSYLFLKGRCSSCGTRIPFRYPVVEAVTGILSAVVAWHFAFTLQAAGALALTWALIPLSVIDFDHKLLPDSITLPLLWLGLLLSLLAVFVDPASSIIGAATGYLSLWTVFHVFRLATGKEGMGYGDFKLLAVFGAWMGWKILPVVIILSSLVGAMVGIFLILFRGRDRNIPIPFGPYLAVAGWIALLWGEDIVNAYLRWAQLA
jgi:leader peptidase (prepilin peptidase)/N-methyltransferase